MSLRVVCRPGRPALYIRGTVRGQSVFESTGTADRRAAETYRVKRESELLDRSVFGARAVVTFAEAVASYLEAEPRSPGQAALVAHLLEHFAGRKLTGIGQEDLDRAYRVLLRPGASPATRLRNVLTPLRAILEHAARRGWCDRPAFEVPKQPKPRVSYLTPPQADALVQAAAAHLRPLIVFLIGTGARMSEALELDWMHVDLTAAVARLVKTKTGIERYVPLPPAVVAALSSLPHRSGRVFRPVHSVRRDGSRARIGAAYRDTGRSGGGQIKSAWAGACRRAGLPGVWKEWTGRNGAERRIWVPELHPHDLRHTAATWHYAIHHDLLRLQQWGGWASVSQVQIYAHVMAEGYATACAAWLGHQLTIGAKSVPSHRTKKQHTVSA